MEENEKEQKQKKSVTQRGQEAYDKAKQARDTVKKVKDAKKAADAAKAGKAAAHGSKILTALGPALPYIGIALLIILIILLIIGIIVFLVTMPGMVMDKLKAMFKELGNKVAAFFGGDTTMQIEDEEIYAVLDYLEDMGYDLKGYGFLTEYMPTSEVTEATVAEELKVSTSALKADNGVIRNTEEDKIVAAGSQFILMYIMSDNYVYTVKNYNIINEDANKEGFWSTLWGGIVAIGQKIAGLVIDEGAAWGKGMIYLEDPDGDEWQNGVHAETWWGKNMRYESVKVDASSKKLIITRGAFANSFEYNLDGWTGRYGMPLEFLLSVHIATNMPDLAYDMVEFFGTEVVIKLHKAEADIEAAYKDVDGQLINYRKMEEIKGEGFWFTDDWCLSAEEAYKILGLGLDSPENCTYTAATFKVVSSTDNGDGWIFDPNNYNTLKSYGGTYGELDNMNDSLKDMNVDTEGEDFKVSEAMVKVHDVDAEYTPAMYNQAVACGYNNSGNDKIESGTGPDKENGAKKILGGCSCTDSPHATTSSTDTILCPTHTTYGQYSYYPAYCKPNTYYVIETTTTERSWYAVPSDATEETIFYWNTHRYRVYSYTNEARTEGEAYVDSFFVDYITRNKTTTELIDDGILDENGKAIEGSTTCSKDAQSANHDTDKACEHCRQYVKKIMSAASDVDTENMLTYTPYLRKVTDHWYRDVYWEMDSGDKIKAVDIDAEYEALMKERWTQYEVYPDSNELAGNSIWYILGKDGNYIKDFNDAARTAHTTTMIDGEEVTIKEVDMSKVKYDNEILEDGEGYCYYFVETADEAKEVGLSVSRKAITTELKSSEWSAYEENTEEEVSGWTKAYPDTDDKIKQNVYIQTSVVGGKKQVEEGARTETNEKIKRIFAVNTYFRYDGNPDTADIIYALRNQNNLGYGNLNGDTGKEKGSDSTLQDNLKKTAKLTLEGDNVEKEFTVKDYSGHLDLTKDSLAAFSMLENTHTVDADYIYKDFKELIVELGYFEKEELSEQVPEIFQWFIPEIGSYGYPLRFADKKDNAYGTMAHSYDDYLALREISIAAAVAEEEEATGEGSGSQKSYGSQEDEDSGAWTEIEERPEGTENTETVSGIANLFSSNSNSNVQTVSGVFDNFTNVSDEEMELIRAANNSSKGVSPSTVPLKKFLETTREMCEYINQVGYDYCVYKATPGEGDYRDDCICNDTPECKAEYERLGRSWICNATGCDCGTNHCKHNVHENSCYLPDTFEESQEEGKHNFCCATLVAWALQNVGVMPDEDHMDGAESCATYVEDVLGAKRIERTEELKEGDILVYEGHVDLVGEESDGGFVKYNGGHHVPAGAVEGQGSDVRYGGSCIEHISGWPNNATYALRLNWGRSEEGVYEGYKGGEAVVSPATGILLEYGEYTGIKDEFVGTEMAAIQNASVDSVAAVSVRNDDIQAVDIDGNVATPNGETAEENIASEDKGDRLNYDLRYPFSGMTGAGQAENAGDTITSGGEAVKPREVYDKVGYAKILVLDDTFYKRLEEHFGVTGENSYQLQNGYKDLNELTTDKLKDWTENQITLYGYKEFVEKYHAFDLGGYIIYMDGFACELPDPEYDIEEPGETVPSGEPLTYDILMDKAATYEECLYEPAETSQLSNKKATEKLKAEEETKASASPLIKVTYTDPEDEEEKDCLFIKEGTVIGRTLTDREVVTARGETYVAPPTEEELEEMEEGEVVKREIVGNYIRIVMRDKDDTVVENVEEYLKLDEMVPMPELEMEKFLYWMGVYVEGGKKEQVGGKWVSKAVDLNDGVGATHYFGLTHYCAGTARSLGYDVSSATWGQDQDMEMLVNTYLARIEEDKLYVQEQLGADIEDGYLQAFISIKHNYGNLTKRGTEYKANGSVSESTWTTYEGTQYAAALTKRRISEWKIISEGRYTECYSNPDKDLVFESETPFTDWCQEMGITVSINSTSGS